MTYWCRTVLETVASAGESGFVVVFPSYRPDLVEDLARALGTAFVDFRRSRLAAHGMAAHRLSLEEIERCASDCANERGIVLHNAEALLAARSQDERRAWLAMFLARPRQGIVVLPLALFGDEVPDHARVVRLSSEEVPAESLLRQLSSLSLQ